MSPLRRTHHNLLHARPAVRRKDKGWAFFYTAVILPIVLVIGFVVFAMMAYFGSVSVKVYSYASAGRNELGSAQDLLGNVDIDGSLVHIDSASEQFSLAAKELDKLRPFAGLPYVGPRINDAGRLLGTGTVTVDAVREVLLVVRDIIDVLKESEGLKGALTGSLPELTTAFKDLTPSQKHRILATLSESAPKIRDASDKIDAALLSLDVLAGRSDAKQFGSSLSSLRPKLEKLRDGLKAFLPAAEHLPTLLGYPTERNYLFFLQNNTELRPTGGFLGTFGVLTVVDAEMRTMETHDVYTYDGPSEKTPRPLPPEPIRKYIGIDKWYLRDANWSPDFPTSVETMERFYNDEAAIVLGGKVPRIDGVIAVTPKLASDILRMTGPVTIDKITFTAENLVDTLEFQVEKGFVASGIPLEQRKRIVAKLAEEIVNRVKTFQLVKLVELLGVVGNDLKEGHISLSMKDPGLQRIVLENDWGGKMKAVAGDYVSVIDANLASLKTDRVMKRTITYSLAPAGQGYEGRLAIRYQNQGGFDWKTTRYRTYTRAYLPAGTVLLGTSGAMENDKLKDPGRHAGKVDTYNELGRTAFGAFISIEPGEIKTLEFRFLLAPGVVTMLNNGMYQLDVEKQAGTLAHGLTLDLDFGKNVRTASPSEDQKEWGDRRYRSSADLRTDRHFNIGF